jgi:hypothetical protein
MKQNEMEWACGMYYLYKWSAKRHINHFTNVVLFTEDTSILITEKNYEHLKQKIRLTLDCTSRWFKANKLVTK